MPKVADVMTRDVITVTPETTLRELATILSEKHINGVPVVDDKGNVLGVVCESDLVNQNKPLAHPHRVCDTGFSHTHGEPLAPPERVQTTCRDHGRRHLFPAGDQH